MNQARGGSFLGHLKRRGRWMALVGLLAVIPMATSCYGRFPLTKALYEFNGDVTDNPIGQTLVMWAFVILPVYGGAMLGDAVVINLLEFWTDERFDIGSATLEDGTAVTLARTDEQHAVMTVSRDGVTLAQRTFVKTPEGVFQVLDEQGQIVGKVVPTANGMLQLTDSHGTVIQTISPDSLHSI